MIPEKARILLHALIDEELDPKSASELRAEVELSPVLRQELARLSALRSSVQTHATRFSAPPGLTQRMFEKPPEKEREPVSPRFLSWWRTLAIGATAAAVTLLIWNLSSTFTSRGNRPALLEEVVSAHIRSLMANHLTDLTSSERHAVKPWLAGRLDFAPPVSNFDTQGFTLLGGRLDYLSGKPVAALVYRHRQHIINVFVWPSGNRDGPMRISTHRGFNSTNFESGGMSYWIVSDLNTTDLQKLAGLLQQPPG